MSNENLEIAQAALAATFQKFGVMHGLGLTATHEPALSLRFQNARAQRRFEKHMDGLPETDPVKTAYTSVKIEKRAFGGPGRLE